MANARKFSFTEHHNEQGESSTLPYLPLLLTHPKTQRSLEVNALLDTGASINVLPYDLGQQLGAMWEEQNLVIPLSGNLTKSEARGLLLSGVVASFQPRPLVFAWTRSNSCPVILGHLNFFQEFNVCFYGKRLEFEIYPNQ